MSKPVRFEFNVGDTVVVHYKILEGEKYRIQPFEGVVISKRGAGVSKTFQVRHVGPSGIGVERIFQLFSPNIEKVEVLKKGQARRAKLFYLRDRIGKEALRVNINTSEK